MREERDEEMASEDMSVWSVPRRLGHRGSPDLVCQAVFERAEEVVDLVDPPANDLVVGDVTVGKFYQTLPRPLHVRHPIAPLTLDGVRPRRPEVGDQLVALVLAGEQQDQRIEITRDG